MKKFFLFITFLVCLLLSSCTPTFKKPVRLGSQKPPCANIGTVVTPTDAATRTDALEVQITDSPSSYCAVFGDCRISLRIGQAAYIAEKEIGDYRFLFPSAFSILVDQNGTTLYLEDAFVKRMISKDILAEIYQIHKEFVIRYYNGEALYKEYE